MEETSSQVTIDRVPDEPGAPRPDDTAADAKPAEVASSQQFDNLPPSPMKAMEKLGGWKMLRSMRTAIWLLLALVVATIIPTFVPQRITDPERVAELAAENSLWYQIAERLKLFDVFVSPWYVAIYVSLLVVLVLCLLPRTREFVRTMRRATSRPNDASRRRGLPNVPHSAEIETDLPPDEALARARSVLGRRRWRRGKANDAGQFIAEKGALREGGSLLFHWSFFLILGAFFVSRAFGFDGFMRLTEQETLAEAPINILRYNPGWFGDSAHRDFEVRLNRFDVEFRGDESAADFVSNVTVIEDGREILTKDVRVNDPLDYRGIKLYQSSFGWSARVVVEDADGSVVFDDFVPLQSDGPRNTWTGVAKIPGTTPQAGLELFFFPTALEVDPRQFEQLDLDDELGRIPIVARDGPPTADNPAMLMLEYRGNLGLDRPQPEDFLDKELLGEHIEIGAAGLDAAPFEFADGLRVSFPELRHYSVFRIKRDPGLWLALIAAIFVVTGLIASLYVSRRRLWVWARRAGGDDTDDDTDTRNDVGNATNRESASKPTLIALGGLAYQRKEAFVDEFDDLSSRVAGAVDGRVVRTKSPKPDSTALAADAEPGVESGRDDSAEPAGSGDRP